MGHHSRTAWTQVLALSISTLVLGGLSGCEAGREFRAAAVPALQTGVTQILTGLLDGIFAVIEPDTDT